MQKTSKTCNSVSVNGGWELSSQQEPFKGLLTALVVWLSWLEHHPVNG